MKNYLTKRNLITLAVLILAIIVVVLMTKGKQNNATSQKTPTKTHTSVRKNTPSSVRSINSDEDLQNALKDVDNTNVDDVGKEIQDNQTDAAGL